MIPSWLAALTGAQRFANNPANGFAPTLGDALQGIGSSMMQHYRGQAGAPEANLTTPSLGATRVPESSPVMPQAFAPIGQASSPTAVAPQQVAQAIAQAFGNRPQPPAERWASRFIGPRV